MGGENTVNAGEPGRLNDVGKAMEFGEGESFFD